MSLIKSFGSLTIQSRSYVHARSLHPKKFTSILQDIPTRPRNGWQIYMNENLHKYKNAHNKRVLDLKEATSELSASWKAMSDAEKKVYHDKFQTAAKRHDEALEKALLNATPKQIKEENELRKKYNLSLLRDPRQPKRCKNSFLLFMDHLKASNDTFIQENHGKNTVSEAAKMYRALSEAEKNVYRDQAKVLQERHNKEMSEYYAMAGIHKK